MAGTSAGNTGTAQGFFPAARFDVFRGGKDRDKGGKDKDRGGPLNWPDYVLLSSDHTSPRCETAGRPPRSPEHATAVRCHGTTARGRRGDRRVTAA